MTNIDDSPSKQLIAERTRVHGATSEGHNAPTTAARTESGRKSKEPGSNKRKATDEGDGHVDKKPFVLRPYPPSMYNRPSTMKPLHLLDRAKLPLCYLDTTSSQSKLPQQSFFSSDIDLSLYPLLDPPQVLIARLEADKTLYAVERIEKSTYAVCRLAHWVKPKDLLGKNAGRLPGRVPLLETSGNGSGVRQDRVTKTRELPAAESFVNGSHSDEPLTITGVPATTAAATPRLNVQPWQASELDLAALAELADEPENAPPLPTQRQLFEKLVCQYMETLYLSKASLAFFAKGPLSRARAAFTRANDKLTVASLADFLRSLCIQSSTMDKKYREKLPELLKELAYVIQSDDELLTRTPQKKKAPRRLHPTRGGMFPLEEDYVHRWWTGEDSISGPRRHGESAETLLRRRLNEVRLRETLLQVIITLETLALECSPEYMSTETEVTILNVDKAQETQDMDTQTGPSAKRPKKRQDLGLALDLLVDKLCIWQSIEQDGTSTVTPKKQGSSEGSAAVPTTSTDHLRDFFSEIVVPFYMSRLPQQVAAIGKKLGGPVASPPKQSTAKPGAAIIRKPPKPGEALSAQKQHRKSLHRVATDTATTQKHARTPSLIRFSSDSAALSNMKRERSCTPTLGSIPLASPTSTIHSRRGSIADFKRLNKRQIDLTALSAVTDAKQKKKAAIDEQVKNAISTLRKPNRGAAVKENVDHAEKRKAVLVDATPKRANKFAAVTPNYVHKAMPALAVDVIPSSGVVPSSSIRPRHAESVLGSARKPEPHITETPSRGGARVISFKDVPVDGRPHDVRMSSSQTTSAISATPSKPRSRAAQPATATAEGVFATPQKSDKSYTRVATSKSLFATPAKHETSIYSALGWDDDVDDLA